ncbi:MAG: hypothetical protein M1823_002421 [Watsoniomyces obsoletus]|nr:MAG: hypothetical protein M1823_002421 [Watsoniomyces obsoletus]
MASNSGNPPLAPDDQSQSHAESSSSAAATTPVVRLDSLSKRGRGAAPLKVKPKATARRSLLEREQAEQEERSRLAAQNAAASQAGRGLPPGRGQRGGRWTRAPGIFGSRGGPSRGYAIPAAERQGLGMASGPFGAGSIITGNKRGVGVKRERGGRNATSSTGTVRESKRASTARGSSVVKDEDMDQLYGSSTDEDDPLQAPRVNIESINLVSDDEGEVEGEGGAPQSATSGIVSRGLLPIRLDAREHVERSRGIELDPQWKPPVSKAKSVAATADENGLFVPQDPELEKNRRRPRNTADVEFIRDNRVFKGVYQEDEFYIKQEPRDDDEDAMDVDPSSVPEGVDAEMSGPSDEQQKIDHQGKGKTRTSSFRVKAPKPVLETEEDRQEWIRHAEDMEMLRAELGKMPGNLEAPETTAGGADDVPMTDEEQQPLLDRKWGQIYLFQFPPVLPGLYDPATTTTEQPSEENDAAIEAEAVPIQAQPSTEAGPSSAAAQGREIGQEEVEVQADQPAMIEDLTKPVRLITPLLHATMPSGRVGKFTVHASGRAVMTWGNTENTGEGDDNGNQPDRYTRMEVHRGTESAFLQDVVLADLGANEGLKTEDADDPDAVSGGKEKGKQRAETNNTRGMACGIAGLSTKFVVTPDWSGLLR